MPTYDYECNPEKGGCGHRFEIMQGIKEKPKRKCPKCEQLKLRRLLGVPGLVFRGSGFYINDYGKNSGKTDL